MNYKQLTAADRKVIEVLLTRNCTLTEIAKELGRNPSTICREIKERSTPNGYFAEIAQVDYEKKRRKTGRRKKITRFKTHSYIESRLRRGWSPEQVSGRMGVEKREDRVCHETIYTWIYTDEYCVKEKLYQYLRYGRKKRQKWRGRKRQVDKIPNRISIHDRPAVVEERTEFGHWEADIVVCPNKKAINTMNELYSSYVVMTRLERKTAALTGVAMRKVMERYEVKTVTVDNGIEFMLHEEVTNETGVPYYFCDPYSSW